MEILAVVYVPLPKSAEQKIAKVKSALTQESGRYRSRPHLSLFTTRMNQRGFKKFVRELRESPLHKVKITFGKPVLKNGKFLMLPIDPSRNLIELHETIAERGKKYWSGALRKNDRRHLVEVGFKTLEKKNLLTYGAPRIGKAFEPHITLGKVTDSSRRPSLGSLESFEAQSCVVGLYRKRSGMATETLAELSLRLIS